MSPFLTDVWVKNRKLMDAQVDTGTDAAFLTSASVAADLQLVRGQRVVVGVPHGLKDGWLSANDVPVSAFGRTVYSKCLVFREQERHILGTGFLRGTVLEVKEDGSWGITFPHDRPELRH